MKIIWQGFTSSKHSWGLCAQNISRQLIKLNHDVELISTDGPLPDDLQKYNAETKLKLPRDRLDYDMSLSYTAPHNFINYLKRSKKNRFAIHAFEFDVLPPHWVKYHNSIDKLMPPSQFAADIYLNAKFPEDKVVVVPHGINLEDYSLNNTEPYKLKTNKQRKILVNLAQIHARKGLPKIFEAYVKAFNKKDDVCLVLKVAVKKTEKPAPFDVDFWKLYKDFQQKYPQHAEIEVITEFIPNIASLYLACDILFSMSHGECFHLPSLEALGAGLIVIAPKHGGVLDFLNDSNSFLIPGKNVRCPKDWQYWLGNAKSSMFDASIDDAVHMLRYVNFNYDMLRIQMSHHINETAKAFTWTKATEKILNLVE